MTQRAAIPSTVPPRSSRGRYGTVASMISALSRQQKNQSPHHFPSGRTVSSGISQLLRIRATAQIFLTATNTTNVIHPSERKICSNSNRD
ncbi:hypothetical protein GRJ2_001439700 [Grus japonensis]|uniref:Uncharacterized protein n=1 Tax=Grus japonensis TaxID=30415 RepID=A0ABC9WY62_GRUJA